MAKGRSTRDASDENLNQAAMAKREATARRPSPGHDADKIRKHDDSGKDRLFEGRQQHDEAEKNSEKTRLARDVQRHDHAVDEQVGDSGTSHAAKRKT